MSMQRKQGLVARVKSTLVGWLSKEIRLTDGSFWSNFFGYSNSTGRPVSVESALRLSTAMACVRLIAQVCAAMPLKLQQRDDGGNVTPASDLALHGVLLYSPNADMTAIAFWESVLACMLLRGTAYVEIHWAPGRGDVRALDLLLPDRLTVRRKTDGSWEYRYVDLDGTSRLIDEANVMPIPAFTLDGVCGISPIKFGADVLSTAAAADEVAGKTFKNGLLSGWYYKIDRVMTEKQREDFRATTERISGALNAGKSPVLEAGMDAKSIGINPDDAQLLESRRWSVEEICRWFGVPPTMVGHAAQGQTNWGTGIEQQMLGFLVFYLTPWLRRIEQAITKYLIRPEKRGRVYAEFLVESLLRADSAARAAFYSVMVQNGLMTRDECRAKENLPKRGANADVLTVQSNLVPIDQLGEGTGGAAKVRDALRDFLNDEGAAAGAAPENRNAA